MKPIQENDVFVQFYSDAIELTFESKKQGRPVYEERPHVRVIIPGDKGNVVERVARDTDKEKYPTAWKRFQNEETVTMKGTPLEQWPQMNRSQVKEAKYFEVNTVEEMAGLSDNHASKLGMGFLTLRTQAKAWLDAAAGGAAASAQIVENERMQSEIEMLKAQIAALAADPEEKRGPGRPRKEAVEA